ncbi:hypothetical protein KY285_025520 [Solanum tuberosum]|nr:hypothetical protein KY289_024397 [Solanum tuberosum]KAH0677719.1 hypothetical protein KY285_025520 [Solanum tuberosum]
MLSTLDNRVPSVNQAYAMTIQEESQRKLGLMEGGKDPMTMLAGRGSRCNNQPQNSQYPPNTSQSKKNQGHVSQGRKLGVICEHCGYKGHTKETCYRIVGFPTDFKIKRRVSTDEDSMPHSHVSTVEAGSSTLGGGTTSASGSDSSHFHFPGGYFTKEHYDQVLKMMVSQPTGSCKANAVAGTHKCNQPIIQTTSPIPTPIDAIHETVVEPAEAEMMVEPTEADLILVDDPVHPDDIQQDNIGPRKTSRATKPPNYLHAFSAVMEPQSYHEASQDKLWVEAMHQEV